MTCQTDHGTADFRLRHKTAWRNIDYDFRFCVILHRQGKCAIFLASRSFLHTIRYFFLYHDRDTVDRHMAFKQSHDDRSRNVIRKICNDLDRFPVIFSSASFEIFTFKISSFNTSTLLYSASVSLESESDWYLFPLPLPRVPPHRDIVSWFRFPDRFPAQNHPCDLRSFYNFL